MTESQIRTRAKLNALANDARRVALQDKQVALVVRDLSTGHYLIANTKPTGCVIVFATDGKRERWVRNF